MARPTARPSEDWQSISFPRGMDIEGKLKVRPTETSAERTHRHRMEVRKFWVEEAPVHLTAIAIVVSCFCVSLWIWFRPPYSMEDKKTAISILTHLLTSVAGFAFGKAAK